MTSPTTNKTPDAGTVVVARLILILIAVSILTWSSMLALGNLGQTGMGFLECLPIGYILHYVSGRTVEVD